MADEMPISEARANLTELVAQVRLLRRAVMLTQRGKPRAGLVPAELVDAVRAVGGPDAAAAALRQFAAKSTGGAAVGRTSDTAKA
jgi:prevent-host-death family protein